MRRMRIDSQSQTMVSQSKLSNFANLKELPRPGMLITYLSECIARSEGQREQKRAL